VLSIVNKRIPYILNIGIVPLECCESRENCYFLNFLKDIIDAFLNRVLNK